METTLKLSECIRRNILEQCAARKFGLGDPRHQNRRFADFPSQIRQTARRFAITPQVDEHGGIRDYFPAGGSFCRVAFTASSNAANSPADKSGSVSAAAKAPDRVPFGGINRLMTAEKVSALPVFHEANRV